MLKLRNATHVCCVWHTYWYPSQHVSGNFKPLTNILLAQGCPHCAVRQLEIAKSNVEQTPAAMLLSDNQDPELFWICEDKLT